MLKVCQNIYQTCEKIEVRCCYRSYTMWQWHV